MERTILKAASIGKPIKEYEARDLVDLCRVKICLRHCNRQTSLRQLVIFDNWGGFLIEKRS